MSSPVRPALVLFLLLTAVTGIVYPLVVTGIARVVFPSQAAGSLLAKDGKAIGSRLIGQSFSDPKYFWSRPSATTPQPYNGLASTGSNLGPLNPALSAGIRTMPAASYRARRRKPGDLRHLGRLVSSRSPAITTPGSTRREPTSSPAPSPTAFASAF